MGAAASLQTMDRDALAAAAERYRVPAAVCAKILENDIDGAAAFEYSQLPEEEMNELAKELFPDSVLARGKFKAALKKTTTAGDTSAGADVGDGGGGDAAAAPAISVPADLVFKPDHLTLGVRLGEGGFAIVSRATFEKAGRKTDVAFKQINPAMMRDARDVDKVQKELQLMHAVSLHPNIVTLLGACPNPRASDAGGAPLGVGLMLELAKGSLYDLLHDEATKPPSWSTRATLSLDTARGMEALSTHSPAIVHRDLKSLNVRQTMLAREREGGRGGVRTLGGARL